MIVMDPQIRFGKPTIFGTRVSVGNVLVAIANHGTISAACHSHGVTVQQVQEALNWAAEACDRMKAGEKR